MGFKMDSDFEIALPSPVGSERASDNELVGLPSPIGSPAHDGVVAGDIVTEYIEELLLD